MRKFLAGLGVFGAILGILICIVLIGSAIASIGLSIYGLVLAFKASLILGIVAFVVEPLPLVIGVIAYCQDPTICQRIAEYLHLPF